jgi:hypothetical protein
MGEIADMMIEGDLCAGCGSYIDSEGGDGFPRYCGSCAVDMPIVNAEHARCYVCNKKVKTIGLQQHMIDKHCSAKPVKKIEHAPKSLRDEFAMAALANLNLQAHVSKPAAENLAESAYNIADAMLEARKS